MITTFKIADITFRAEADVRIPFLSETSFRSFHVEDEHYDVLYRFQGVPDDTLTMQDLMEEEKRLLSRTHYSGLESKLLGSPFIRGKLHEWLDSQREILLQFHPHWMFACDFDQLLFDFFYVSSVGKEIGGSFASPRMYPFFFPVFSAALIHSAAAVWEEMGVVFLANNGGGKTSILRTLPPECSLCDDQNVLRQVGDTVKVFGTPWGQIANARLGVPLNGLFLLEQADTFELIPIQPREALEFLWHGGVQFPWTDRGYITSYIPKYLRVRIFEMLRRACHQAVTYRMRFPKDYVDWRAIAGVLHEADL